MKSWSSASVPPTRVWVWLAIAARIRDSARVPVAVDASAVLQASAILSTPARQLAGAIAKTSLCWRRRTGEAPWW